MAEERVRWGILGTASIARRCIVPAIQHSNNGELVAVASRSEQKANDFASKLSIPRIYGSYEALLAADDIDAVYIPLPNNLHKEWTVKAAEAGKHILCEKPLALNEAECHEMDAAARRNGVKLLEAFMYRFHPQTDKVLELIRSGTIGEPRLIHAALTWHLTIPTNIRLQPELGGGSLMDVGCYCVSVIRTLAGAEPVEVQAYANWGETGVDVQMAGTLRFADGLLGQFDCALTLGRRGFYQIVGPGGYIDVPMGFLPGTEDTTIYANLGLQGSTVYTVPGLDQYQAEVEHFADCILHQTSVRYPALEAAANMRVIEALDRSARNGGKPEKL